MINAVPEKSNCLISGIVAAHPTMEDKTWIGNGWSGSLGIKCITETSAADFQYHKSYLSGIGVDQHFVNLSEVLVL